MELEAVQDIIDEEVATFMRWTASLQTVPVLHELQQRFEAIREAEWERTERRLRNLSPAERDAVEQMTRAMVKKMLHEPWRYLRANSGSVEAAAALQSLIDVFDLEASQPPPLCESEPAPLRPPVPAPRRSAPGTLEGA
jgi:glutamyl-tRNA reductase